MVTATTQEILISRANIFFAATGQAPVTPVGYKSGATKIAYKEKLTGHFVEDRDGAIFATRDTIEGGIKAKMVQVNPTLLALAMGKAENGNSVAFGGVPTAVLEYAIKVIGTRRDGTAVTFYLYRAVSDGGFDIDIDKKKMTEIDLSFMGLDGDTDADVMGKVEIGAGNITATLSSGVLTRTAAAGYHQVGGQSGAADVLDSITGASLTNGEILRLQILSETAPITLTHLADTLELTGAVDWVMTKLGDYIDLRYDSTKTGWVEISRFDSRA